MGDLKLEWKIAAELGEGPVWVERESAIYWVDIIKHHVHRLSLADGTKKSWTFNTEVTSLAERAQGGFAATVRNGFAFIDFASSSYEPIVLPEADMPGNRFNDGKVDAHGRFWSGSMNEAGEVASGSLYCLDGDLTIEGKDGFSLTESSPMSLISRDVLDLVAQTIGPHHQYPDGLALFIGTLFAPTQDRHGEGKDSHMKSGMLSAFTQASWGRCKMK